MTAVKGSAQYRMVVMPYRPMRRAFNYFIGLMLLMIVGASSFFFGYDRGAAQNLVAESAGANQDLGRLQHEAEALRQEVANLKLAAIVDAQAHEDVWRQTIEQKSKIAELERNIAVYRGMIAKSDKSNPSGISIGAVQISGSGGVRGYKYKFVVQQLVAHDETFKGTMSINIVGARAGQKMAIPLSTASMQVPAELIPLNFKYFQSIEGDLLLPEGFAPEHIDVVIKSSNKKHPTHIERQLDWSVAG